MSVRGDAARWSTTRSRCPMTFVTRSLGTPQTTGWSDPIWLETPADRSWPAITDDVVSANPDRVIVVGGDGTIRIVADRLAQSGIPMAVVPVGTGNLLARNLEIPLSELEALEVAFGEHTRGHRFDQAHC